MRIDAMKPMLQLQRRGIGRVGLGVPAVGEKGIGGEGEGGRFYKFLFSIF
jgi:hypothetical protein